MEGKHLGGDESLRELIKEDERTLDELGVSFEQIKDMFDLIWQLVGRKHSGLRLLPEWCISCGDPFTLIPKTNSQWCVHGSGMTRLGEHLYVCFVSWGGAETCPFQSPADERYHGFEYGSTDLVFYKQSSVCSICMELKS